MHAHVQPIDGLLNIASGVTSIRDMGNDIDDALVALAVGHAPAVEHPRPQTRWRFSSGGALGNGVVQLVALAMTASGIYLTSVWFLAAAVAAWAASLWWYGRELERSLA
jgi:hypothetical protein